MRLIPTLLIAAFAAAPALAQVPQPPGNATLDQDSPMANVSFNGNLVNFHRAQSILCQQTGLLAGISFEVWGGGVSSDVNVYGPYPSPQPPTGTPAGSFTLPGQGGGWVETFLDMESAGIVMNSNEYWTIEILGAPASCDYTGNQSYPYEMWETAGSTTYTLAPGNSRIGLKTWMLPVPPPTPTIALTGTCPGPGSLVMSNMTASAPVGIGFGFFAGPTVMNAGGCAALNVGILNAQVVGIVTADSNGDAVFVGNLTPAACGGYVQVLDIGSCTLSNVLNI